MKVTRITIMIVETKYLKMRKMEKRLGIAMGMPVKSREIPSLRKKRVKVSNLRKTFPVTSQLLRLRNL